MPGYLMDMMVLIETDKWLVQLMDTLGPRKNKSDLEDKIHYLASQAYKYLHFDYDPSVVTEKFPEVSPAQIDNGIGSGITQYAFMGAIGPDFPAAGNILALNHGWIATTMHIGAPRRALKKAGTTTFVLKCISDDVRKSTVKAVGGDDQSDTVVKQYKKPMMAYLLGHLSSIATHVLVEPFINQVTWIPDDVDRTQFVVQLDAQIAKGYFQRKDLRDGQSWTAYLPDIGYLYNCRPKGVRLITEMYQRGFKRTYGDNPRENLSNFPNDPSVQPLRKSIESNEKLNEASKKKLKEALDGVYTGYGDLLKDSTDEDHIEEAIQSIKGLKKLLMDYEAKTPNLGPDLGPDLHPDPHFKDPDPPFLIDGYRNTRNWALGWGYDRSPSLPWPPWRFSIIMSLAVLYGSIGPFLDLGVTEDIWKEVTDPGFPAPNVKRDLWVCRGMFGSHLMWHDALDKSYSVSGSILWVFNSVLSGIQICDVWQTGKGTQPGQSPKKKKEKVKEGVWGSATPASICVTEFAAVGLGTDAPITGKPLVDGAILGPTVGGVFGTVILLASLGVRRLTDGIFGEGTDGWKDWWLIRKGKWGFKWANFLKSNGFGPPLKGWLDILDDVFGPIIPEVWPWISHVVDTVTDGLDTFYYEQEDASKGQEGDRLQRRIYFLQLWMTGTYFLSSLLVFGVKAADDPRTVPPPGTVPPPPCPAPCPPSGIVPPPCLPPGLNARDYLLSLIFPVLLIAFKVWYQGGFEGELLKSITGVDWPSTHTAKVEGTILPIGTDGTGRNVFTTTNAKPLPVRLFAEDVMKQWTPPGARDNTSYPQNEAEDIPWDDIPKRDRQERNIKSHDSKNTYTLKDLLDKAKFFSGILAMAAVNYDTSSDEKCAEQIFLDWNLNLRTEDEWNELIEARPDGTPGFVKAAQQWWEAISKGVDPDPSAVLQMEIALCLKKGPVRITGRIEDRTVAPNNDKQNTAHIYLLNAPFKIVDAKGKVVKTDSTDKDGNFSFTLPGPGDYELQVDGYQGIQWTNLESC